MGSDYGCYSTSGVDYTFTNNADDTTFCDDNWWGCGSSEVIVELGVDPKQHHRDLMLGVIADQKRQPQPFNMVPPQPRMQPVWKPCNF